MINLKVVKKNFLFSIGIPFNGRSSLNFAKRLTVLIKKKFNVDVNTYFTTLSAVKVYYAFCLAV